MITPYFVPYVPKRLRKYIAPFLPLSNMRKFRDIATTMDEQARLIFRGKMEALKKGDAAVMQQIGEGRDLLSVLGVSVCSMNPRILMHGVQHERICGLLTRRGFRRMR